MSDTRKDLKTRIDDLLNESQYHEALPLARKLVDEFYTDYSLGFILDSVTFGVKEIHCLIDECNASSVFLLGFMFWCGAGGAGENIQAAFRCFSRAAENGHVYAGYLCGFCLYDGLRRGRLEGGILPGY